MRQERTSIIIIKNITKLNNKKKINLKKCMETIFTSNLQILSIQCDEIRNQENKIN